MEQQCPIGTQSIDAMMSSSTALGEGASGVWWRTAWMAKLTASGPVGHSGWSLSFNLCQQRTVAEAHIQERERASGEHVFATAAHCDRCPKGRQTARQCRARSCSGRAGCSKRWARRLS
eukprot:2836629-Prymnesium_polylepis.1